MSDQISASPPLFIDGQRRNGAAPHYAVHNPARPREVVAHAPAADLDQLNQAVQSARAASPDWSSSDSTGRAQAILAAVSSASRNAADADLATTYTREHGKVRAEARFEFDAAPAIAEILSGLAGPAIADERIDEPSAYPRIQRAPYGVAALILPFNWPVSLLMTKLTSALVAGNTAVVKVPPSCPLAVLTFGAGIASELPPGVLNLVAEPGTELGQRLVEHPDVDVVSMTGGVASGRAVMAAAATTLTPVILELGGNDAALIAPDLPVSDELIERLFAATFTTTGQVCMAIKRLYAPRERVAELTDALLERCSRELIGDGLAADVTLGPLHTAAARDRVATLVADARSHGGTAHTAGRLREADRDSDGYFLLPTLVTDVAASAAVVTEEQFGPVLPLLGYDDVVEAIAAANATRFGLTASVWSADEALAETIATQLVAGTVSINCHGTAAQDPRVPFGGVGRSGVGRELGMEGIRGFTQSRGIVRQNPPM